MQLWKVSVPKGGRGGWIFVEAPSWFLARDVCRLIHHDEALEKNWNEMEAVERTVLVNGDSIFSKSPTGEILKKTAIVVVEKKPAKRKAKSRKK